MFNQSKRVMLKSIGAASAGLATLGPVAVTNAAFRDSTASNTSKDRLSIQVQHSWSKNDVELIVRNNSGMPVVVTEISPPQLTTESGTVDFSSFTENGPVTIDADEELTFPFVPNSDSVSGFSHFDRTLQTHIKNSVVITTHNMVAAEVATIFNPRII